MDSLLAKLKLSERILDNEGEDVRDYLFDMLVQMSHIAASIGEDEIAHILREIIVARQATGLFRDLNLQPN